MRKLIVMFVAAAFVCSMGAMAAEKTTTTAKHTTLMHASGELVSASASSIVVKEKDKEVTFSANDKTTFHVQGKPAKVEDLKSGDHVNVKYEHTGDAMIAHDIAASAPAAASTSTKPATTTAKTAEPAKK